MNTEKLIKIECLKDKILKVGQNYSSPKGIGLRCWDKAKEHAPVLPTEGICSQSGIFFKGVPGLMKSCQQIYKTLSIYTCTDSQSNHYLPITLLNRKNTVA